MPEQNKTVTIIPEWAGYKKNGKYAVLVKNTEGDVWYNLGLDFKTKFPDPSFEKGKSYTVLVGEDNHHNFYINGFAHGVDGVETGEGGSFPEHLKVVDTAKAVFEVRPAPTIPQNAPKTPQNTQKSTDSRAVALMAACSLLRGSGTGVDDVLIIAAKFQKFLEE